jgi:hypothetical protein
VKKVSVLSILLLITLAVTCSRKYEPTVIPPTPVPSVSLESEIQRLQSNLLWEDGVPVPHLGNDKGDVIYRSSHLCMLAPELCFREGENNILEFVERTIQPDGRPTRSPEWSDFHNSDSFSRDQLTGLILFKETDLLAPIYLTSVYGYYTRTGKLCSDASDTRCSLTPAIEVLWKDALGLEVSYVKRSLANTQLWLDFQTGTDNFRLTLLATHLFIKNLQGKIEPTHLTLLESIRNRSPRNLFYRYLDSVLNKKDTSALRDDLLSCMIIQNGGGIHWAFEQSSENWCRPGLYGHELVALAIALTR